MPRNYTPRPRIERPCACGCGRTVVGKATARFYSSTCRTRYLRAQRRSEPILHGGPTGHAGK